MAEQGQARVRLGAELAALRRLAGFTSSALAARIGVSQSRLSRIERGAGAVTRGEIVRWVDATVDEADRAVRLVALTPLAHAAAGGFASWPGLFSGRTHLQEDASRREQASRMVCNFQPTIVPGLLQTVEYARALVTSGAVRSDLSMVAARMHRQRVLDDPARQFRFLVAESALAWAPDPAVMPAQLARLRHAVRPTVEVRLLPADAGVRPAWSNFILHEPEDDSPRYATVELEHGQLTVGVDEEVAAYIACWDRMWPAGTDVTKFDW